MQIEKVKKARGGKAHLVRLVSEDLEGNRRIITWCGEMIPKEETTNSRVDDEVCGNCARIKP